MNKRYAIVVPARGAFSPQHQTEAAPSVTSSNWQNNTFVLIEYGETIKF